MPLSHAPVASRPSRTAPPSHPPYITPSAQTPPFSHIIPYALPPSRPRSPPAPRPRAPTLAPRLPPRSRPALAPGAGPRWNAMKPRIQCVLTQWIPGFTALGDPPDAVDPRFHCVGGPARRSGFPVSPRPGPTRANPKRQPRANRAQPLIRGKPFLTASNPSTDYAELPTARTNPERIEGVSRSLPFSDLLALTSSHMFFSVMN
jgi:hypothetical protein